MPGSQCTCEAIQDARRRCKRLAGCGIDQAIGRLHPAGTRGLASPFRPSSRRAPRRPTSPDEATSSARVRPPSWPAAATSPSTPTTGWWPTPPEADRNEAMRALQAARDQHEQQNRRREDPAHRTAQAAHARVRLRLLRALVRSLLAAAQTDRPALIEDVALRRLCRIHSHLPFRGGQTRCLRPLRRVASPCDQPRHARPVRPDARSSDRRRDSRPSYTKQATAPAPAIRVEAPPETRNAR